MNQEPFEMFLQFFKALGDETRLRIVALLGERPRSVGDLAAALGLSEPTVSHHLKKLTECGLINREQQGRTVTHTVVPEAFAELRGVLQMD